MKSQNCIFEIHYKELCCAGFWTLFDLNTVLRGQRRPGVRHEDVDERAVLSSCNSHPGWRQSPHLAGTIHL